MAGQQEPPERGNTWKQVNFGFPASNKEEQRTQSDYQGEGQGYKDNLLEKTQSFH